MATPSGEGVPMSRTQCGLSEDQLARETTPDDDTMLEAGTISLVLARFDPVIARGLLDILRQDDRLDVVASDVEYAELERAIAKHTPRVAIVDPAGQREVGERLRSDHPATELVVFTHEPTVAFGMLSLASGTTCIAWSLSAADIVASVHLAAKGGRSFVSADGETVERHFPRDAGLLTDREIEVLGHLSRNAAYAEIALALGIASETVRRHAVSIRRKLKAPSRHDLIGLPTSRRAADS